jgi:hypothetical protein
MGKINLGRVILGGLLAGVVLNVGESILNMPILGAEWEEAMRSLNKTPFGGSAIAIFVVLGFLLGIAIVWLYAAIRPRFGAGPKTAVCAGLFVWAIAYLYLSVGQMPLNIFPVRLLAISTIWGLVEVPLSRGAAGFSRRSVAVQGRGLTRPGAAQRSITPVGCYPCARPD